MYFSVELDEENPIVELSFSIFGFLNSYIEIIKHNRLILPSCLKFYLLVFILKMTKLPRMFLVQTQQQLPYSPQQIHIIESCCHH